MTELEALAKDCIENHTHKLVDKPTKQDIYTREESIYISGYRECERRYKKEKEELQEKLTKSKNIIRHIIDMAHCWDIETGEKQHWKIEEAKTFLKEE